MITALILGGGFFCLSTLETLSVVGLAAYGIHEAVENSEEQVRQEKQMFFFKRKSLFRVCYETTDGTKKILMIETNSVNGVKEFMKTMMPGFKILEILELKQLYGNGYRNNQ